MNTDGGGPEADSVRTVASMENDPHGVFGPAVACKLALRDPGTIPAVLTCTYGEWGVGSGEWGVPGMPSRIGT